MATIKIKNGSGAPAASDLVQGEPALDLTNKRLYTEDSGGNVIEIGTNPGVDVTFADNRKAVFGADSDLQIYHDGSNSYIADYGNGDLKIRSNKIRMEAPDSQNMIIVTEDAGVQAFYNGTVRLAVNNTGIDVTGTATMDGLTVNKTLGNIAASFINSDSGNSYIQFQNSTTGTTTYTDGSLVGIDFDESLTIWQLESNHIKFGTAATERMRIDSAGNVGIGDTSPSVKLDVYQSTAGIGAVDFRHVNGNRILLNPSYNYYDAYNHIFRGLNGTATHMTIDNSGNVGIGTSSPASELDVAGTTPTLTIKDTQDKNWTSADTTLGELAFRTSDTSGIGAHNVGFVRAVNEVASGSTPSGALSFGVAASNANASEAMRIDSSGNVGIGRTNPSSYTTDNTSLYVKGQIRVDGVTNTAAVPSLTLNDTNSGLFAPAANAIAISTGAAERMRIDSGGNVLVGKTSSNYTVAGAELRDHGTVGGTTTTQTPFFANRTTNDGALFEFYRGTGTVGQINARSGDLVIGTGTTGLQFYDVGNAIFPLSASGNTNRDAAIDLGEASNRFKDFYLSGNVTHGVTPSSSAAGVFTEAVGRTTYSRGSGVGGFGHLSFINGNGAVGSVVTSGTATAYNTSSDQRLKENIADADDAGSKVDAIQVRKYDWKADGSHQDYGMIAQELLEVAPEAVSEGETEDDMMGVDYSKLVPMLVKEIQSLRARVAQLEGE